MYDELFASFVCNWQWTVQTIPNLLANESNVVSGYVHITYMHDRNSIHLFNTYHNHQNQTPGWITCNFHNDAIICSACGHIFRSMFNVHENSFNYSMRTFFNTVLKKQQHWASVHGKMHDISLQIYSTKSCLWMESVFELAKCTTINIETCRQKLDRRHCSSNWNLPLQPLSIELNVNFETKYLNFVLFCILISKVYFQRS